MKKRFLSMLLTLCLLTGLLAVGGSLSTVVAAAKDPFAPSASDFGHVSGAGTGITVADNSAGTGVTFTVNNVQWGNHAVQKDYGSFNGLHFVVENIAFTSDSKVFTFMIQLDQGYQNGYSAYWDEGTNSTRCSYGVGVDFTTGDIMMNGAGWLGADPTLSATDATLIGKTSLEVKGVIDETGCYLLVNGNQIKLVDKGWYDRFIDGGADYSKVHVGFDSNFAGGDGAYQTYSFDLVSLHGGETKCNHTQNDPADEVTGATGGSGVDPYAPSASGFVKLYDQGLNFAESSNGLSFSAAGVGYANQVATTAPIAFDGMHMIVENFQSAGSDDFCFWINTAQNGADAWQTYNESSAAWGYYITISATDGKVDWFAPQLYGYDVAHPVEVAAVKDATEFEIKGFANATQGIGFTVNGTTVTMVLPKDYATWSNAGASMSSVYLGFDVGGGLTNWGTQLSNYSFDLVSFHDGADTCDHGTVGKATFKYASLSLLDDIGVNFYVALEGAYTADLSKSKMVFTVDGKAAGEVATSAAVYDEETGCYKYTCHVAAKQMGDTIKADFVYDGQSVVAFDYTVKQYATYLINNSAFDDSKALAKALLNYGAAAQTRFAYKDNALVNAGLDLTAPSIPDAVLNDFGAVKAGTVSGIVYDGTSVVLESKTVLRHYFKAENGIDGLTFKVNGVEADAVPTADPTVWYVDVKNIAAKDLKTTQTVAVNDTLTIDCSVYSYIRAINGNASANALTKAVVAAAYEYCEAANVYFAARN